MTDARLREIAKRLLNCDVVTHHAMTEAGQVDRRIAYVPQELRDEAAVLLEQLATIRLREESTARQVRGETIELREALTIARFFVHQLATVYSHGPAEVAVLRIDRALTSPIVAKRSGEGE